MIAEYKDVELCHDERTLLSNVTFTIKSGQLIYVTGEVGSGKTSLLRSIYGEMPIESGEASVLDLDITKIKARKLPRLRKQLGIVFQDFQLLRDRTVESNLDFVLQATGWNKKADRKERIAQVLQQTELSDKGKHMPYELSGGEQQRVCIARALLNSPKLLLADEPTANLDYENGKKVMQLLLEVCHAGTAVIMTTHNNQWPIEFPGKVWSVSNGQLQTFEDEELDDEEDKIETTE